MARVTALRSDKIDKDQKDRGAGLAMQTVQSLHRRRETIGIILLALALFVLLSELSLAVGDGKLMGPVGTWVATALYSLVGVGSLLCAYGLLVLAVRCLRTDPLRVRALGVAGLCGAGLCAGMLLHLCAGNYRLHSMPPGGAVGEYGAELMRALVGAVGTALLCVAGLLVSVVGTTSISFRSVGGTLVRAGHSALGLLTDGVRAVFPTDDEAEEAEADAEAGDQRDDVAKTQLLLKGRRGRDAAIGGVPIFDREAPQAPRSLDREAPQAEATPVLRTREMNPALKEVVAEPPVKESQARESQAKEPQIKEPPARETQLREPQLREPQFKEPPAVAVAAQPEVKIAERPPTGGKDKLKKARPAAPAPMRPVVPVVAEPSEADDLAAEDDDDGDPLRGAPTMVDVHEPPPQPQIAQRPQKRPAAPPAAEARRLVPARVPVPPIVLPEPPPEPAEPPKPIDLAEADELDEQIAEEPVRPPPEPVKPAPPPQPVIELGRVSKKPEVKPEAKKNDYLRLTAEYKLPTIDLLDYTEQGQGDLDRQAMLELAQRLERTLADYQVKGRVSEIHPGPVVTMFEFVPAPGIKLSKITSLSNDLAMALEALRVRIVAPIPGKAAVGIEVPNKSRETVFLKEILADECFTKAKSKVTMALGKDIAGMPICVDMTKMPHLLVAGTTGSGKSVSVNGMVSSILFNATPDEVKMIMIDPKMLELSIYEGIPHLLLPVVTDPKKAALALQWAVDEMERRYELISKSGVRDIGGYNKKIEKLIEDGPRPTAQGPRFITVPAVGPDGIERDVQVYPSADAVREVGGEVTEEILEEISDAVAEFEADRERAEKLEPPRKLPYIVVLIDEFADLMMVASKEVEISVARIAQKARAAGIHLILATQRPSVDVITGLIKANFPSRIAFQVASRIDSRTILDAQGAENLLGMGDMLFTDRGQALRRIHGALITDTEIHKLVEHLKKQGQPVYDMDILKPRFDEEDEEDEDQVVDEMYDQAMRLVIESRQASISMVQRKLRIGYNRAARMIERMEKDGIVSGADGVKGREVLAPNHI